MILVTVHPAKTGTEEYGPAADTYTCNDLGEAMKLFGDSGSPGMPFQYVVSDKESGEPLVTYFAENGDLANGLSKT